MSKNIQNTEPFSLKKVFKTTSIFSILSVLAVLCIAALLAAMPILLVKSSIAFALKLAESLSKLSTKLNYLFHQNRIGSISLLSVTSITAGVVLLLTIASIFSIYSDRKKHKGKNKDITEVQNQNAKNNYSKLERFAYSTAALIPVLLSFSTLSLSSCIISPKLFYKSKFGIVPIVLSAVSLVSLIASIFTFIYVFNVVNNRSAVANITATNEQSLESPPIQQTSSEPEEIKSASVQEERVEKKSELEHKNENNKSSNLYWFLNKNLSKAPEPNTDKSEVEQLDYEPNESIYSESGDELTEASDDNDEHSEIDNISEASEKGHAYDTKTNKPYSIFGLASIPPQDHVVRHVTKVPSADLEFEKKELYIKRNEAKPLVIRPNAPEDQEASHLKRNINEAEKLKNHSNANSGSVKENSVDITHVTSDEHLLTDSESKLHSTGPHSTHKAIKTSSRINSSSDGFTNIRSDSEENNLESMNSDEAKVIIHDNVESQIKEETILKTNVGENTMESYDNRDYSLGSTFSGQNPPSPINSSKYIMQTKNEQSSVQGDISTNTRNMSENNDSFANKSLIDNTFNIVLQCIKHLISEVPNSESCPENSKEKIDEFLFVIVQPHPEVSKDENVQEKLIDDITTVLQESEPKVIVLHKPCHDTSSQKKLVTSDSIELSSNSLFIKAISSEILTALRRRITWSALKEALDESSKCRYSPEEHEIESLCSQEGITEFKLFDKKRFEDTYMEMIALIFCGDDVISKSEKISIFNDLFAVTYITVQEIMLTINCLTVDVARLKDLEINLSAIKEMQEQLSESNKQYRDISKIVENNNLTIKDMESQVSILQGKLAQAQEELNERELKLEQGQEEFNKKNQEINIIQHTLMKNNKELDTAEQDIEEKGKEIEQLKQEIEGLNKQLQEELNKKDQEVTENKEVIKRKEEKLNEVRMQLAEKVEELNNVVKVNDSNAQELKQAEEVLKEKELQVEQLERDFHVTKSDVEINASVREHEERKKRELARENLDVYADNLANNVLTRAKEEIVSTREIANLKQEIEGLNKQLQEELNKKDQEVTENKERIREKEERLNEVRIQLAEKVEELSNVVKVNDSNAQEREIEVDKSTNKKLEQDQKELEAKELQLEQVQGELDKLHQALVENNKELGKARQDVKEKVREIESLEQTIENHDTMSEGEASLRALVLLLNIYIDDNCNKWMNLAEYSDSQDQNSSQAEQDTTWSVSTISTAEYEEIKQIGPTMELAPCNLALDFLETDLTELLKIFKKMEILQSSSSEENKQITLKEKLQEILDSINIIVGTQDKKQALIEQFFKSYPSEKVPGLIKSLWDQSKASAAYPQINSRYSSLERLGAIYESWNTDIDSEAIENTKELEAQKTLLQEEINDLKENENFSSEKINNLEKKLQESSQENEAKKIEIQCANNEIKTLKVSLNQEIDKKKELKQNIQKLKEERRNEAVRLKEELSQTQETLINLNNRKTKENEELQQRLQKKESKISELEDDLSVVNQESEQLRESLFKLQEANKELLQKLEGKTKKLDVNQMIEQYLEPLQGSIDELFKTFLTSGFDNEIFAQIQEVISEQLEAIHGSVEFLKKSIFNGEVALIKQDSEQEYFTNDQTTSSDVIKQQALIQKINGMLKMLNLSFLEALQSNLQDSLFTHNDQFAEVCSNVKEDTAATSLPDSPRSVSVAATDEDISAESGEDSSRASTIEERSARNFTTVNSAKALRINSHNTVSDLSEPEEEVFATDKDTSIASDTTKIERINAPCHEKGKGNSRKKASTASSDCSVSELPDTIIESPYSDSQANKQDHSK